MELARTAHLEDVAQLLWDAEQPADFSCATPMRAGEPGRVAAFTALAGLAASGHSIRGRLTRVLHTEGQGLVGQLANAFGARPGRQPLHLRFAQGWKLTPRVAELLRTAMVLLVDHELTSSAFVARISASTGASLPACLLAGLSTLSGPLHGDASGRVQALFSEVERLGEEAWQGVAAIDRGEADAPDDLGCALSGNDQPLFVRIQMRRRRACDQPTCVCGIKCSLVITP